MTRLNLPRIRELCSALGISTTAYAAALGVHPATVDAWAKGKSRLPFDSADQTARMLGVDIETVIIRDVGDTDAHRL